MNDTVFGKIIRGEIPAEKVYEDEICLAFLDINPISKGHVLVIPKEHFTWFQEVPDEILSHLIITAKKIAHILKNTLTCDYVKLIIEGKDVPHAHIHLIPSMLDTQTVSYSHISYGPGEIATYASKIRESILQNKPA